MASKRDQIRQANDQKFKNDYLDMKNKLKNSKVKNDRLEVDQITQEGEKNAIIQALNNEINYGTLKFSQSFASHKKETFRLERGIHKGEHYEIQRNNVSGKTSVAVVKGPDGIIDLINNLVDGASKDQIDVKYKKIVANALLKSLIEQSKINLTENDVKSVLNDLDKFYS